MTTGKLFEIDRRVRTVVPGIVGNGPESSKFGVIESFNGCLTDTEMEHILHSLQIKGLAYSPDCTYSVVGGGGRVLTRFAASQIPAQFVDRVRDAYFSEDNQQKLARIPSTTDERVASVDEAARYHNANLAPQNLVRGVNFHSDN